MHKTAILIKIFLLCLVFNGAFAQIKAKPLVVFVTGDHEYSGEETLPLIAAELEKNYGLNTKVLKAYPNQNAENNIQGLEILAKADLVVFFLRWRQLPVEQLEFIINI